MEVDERNKKHTYSDTEKVARIEHKNGNSYVRKEGQAEALLAMEVDERNKKHTYSDTEKVARIEHKNGNSYVRKDEWKMAMKHYDRGIKLLQEVNLANREEEEKRQRILLKLYLNVAHCCLKVHWPKKACIACR